MNSEEITTRQIIGTFKSIYRDEERLWKPLSLERSHLKTCHVGGLAVTESVRAASDEVKLKYFRTLLLVVCLNNFFITQI